MIAGGRVGDDLFWNPVRNQSKMSAATETIRREFKNQMIQNEALPGYLKGALDSLRLKRNQGLPWFFNRSLSTEFFGSLYTHNPTHAHTHTHTHMISCSVH